MSDCPFVSWILNGFTVFVEHQVGIETRIMVSVVLFSEKRMQVLKISRFIRSHKESLSVRDPFTKFLKSFTLSLDRVRVFFEMSFHALQTSAPKLKPISFPSLFPE